jgi:uncharacterized membrane protein YkoI
MNCSQKKIAHSSKEIPMAYNPDNYINGVDQRTVAQQRKDEKEQAMKRASKLKEGMRKRILNVKTKSPSATDVQSGKVSGAVKSNKSKTTVKEKAMPVTKKAAAKPMAKPAVKAPAKTTTKAPAKTPTPKTTKKPEKMTPQDAAMKKILEKKYGKIYG